MTPTEFILNGIYAACDNAHDMGLKSELQIGGTDWWVEGDPPPLAQEQYAVWVILDDICVGSGDDYPDSPYLEQWDDDDELVPAPCKRVLRLALGDALTQFQSALLEEMKQARQEAEVTP